MRAAGLALTKVLASEGAGYNVLVNTLITEMIASDQTVRGHRRQAPEQIFDKFLAARAKSLVLPMGRFGTAEEFANLACFLVSDASYISGATINVDGANSPAA